MRPDNSFKPTPLRGAAQFRCWVMKIAFALVVALVGLAGESRADCLSPMQGGVQVSFQVQSCRIVTAPRPDKRKLVRIRVANLAVRTAPGSGDAPEVVSSYEMIAPSISSARTVYVESGAKSGCAPFPEGRQVVASAATTCCDTIPHKGLCALPGPIVRPN